jgi:hypothetical protein
MTSFVVLLDLAIDNLSGFNRRHPIGSNLG